MAPKTQVALTVFLLVVSATILFAAETDHRFVQLFRFPGTGETVVIAEGDLEPRSIGSYTLRIYKGRSAKFPTDEFITGIVRPRNGTIDAVRFADVDRDDRADVIVVMRSAGSGGYLSAEAFRYHDSSLELLGSVAGLDKAPDVVEALRDQLRPRGSGRPLDP
ncbi:MAG TPA: PliI family lysozyme inhibitor of I-type lysozyme [Candidatus Binatia bacterium]